VNAPATNATRDIRVRIDISALDAIFADLDTTHAPGAAIGIAVDGKPVYRKAYGLATLNLPNALTTSTRLRIGSTTKHFTALAYLLLCEEGLCHIDDPIRTFLPELNAVSHPVTMRQLMSCTSGLRDAYDIFYQFNESFDGHGVAESVTSADILALYETIDDVSAPAGTTWLYNNGGYLILSEVIQRVAGQTLEDVLRRRIFEPAGLWDTFLHRRDDGFVPNSGSQHARNPGGQFERLPWGVDNLLGAGAIVSTADDLLRWLAYINEPRIGNSDTWHTLRTPSRLANGTKTQYGLGLRTQSYRGAETLEHGGWALGGSAQMLKVPSVGLDVAVLTNREDVFAPQLVDRVLDTCLEGLAPAHSRQGSMLATGTFLSPEGHAAILSEKSGRQVVAIGGTVRLYAMDAQGVMQPDDGYPGITVRVIGDRSTPSSIICEEYQHEFELHRVDSPDEFDVEQVVGCYRNNAIRTNAWIEEDSGGYVLRVAGPFGSTRYGLARVAPRVWQTKPGRLQFLGAILVFDEAMKEFSWTKKLGRPLKFQRSN
jgi:CubicO group peptidase (beta-lactamase class C family)